MSTFAVFRKSDGQEVYRYDSATSVEWTGFEYATHDHVQLPDAPVAAPAAVAPVRISKLAFRNRFTPSEKIAIELAAQDNPNAPLQQRQISAALRSTLTDQRDAVFIELTREDTRAGLLALESFGLIAKGRAAQIVDTPPTDLEIYRG